MVARLSALAVLTLVAACGGRAIHPWEYQPRALADTIPIYEPEERKTSLAYDQIYGAFSGMGRVVALNRHVAGLPPALNADPFDEVVDSAWFTNRNHVEPLSPDEVFRGPQSSEGPDQSGTVAIWSIKTQGITKGFWIEDSKGDRYILKFDPVEHPEINSAAEVISTNLFWAMGYNVPENYVFYLDPSKLVLDDDDDLEISAVEDGVPVMYDMVPDEPGERQLTMEVFRREFLDASPSQPDGTIRVLASKFLEGTPKGPFGWEGVREDDPNDVIRHEHRREIRGLYVPAAWLNHVDTKQGNTLDMFIESPASPEGEDAPKIGYVRHHLIDLGSTLGSGSAHAHNPRHGTEYDFDASAVLLRMLTFGGYKRPWQRMLPYPETHPSTGYYSIDNFDPADWRPNIVNPAFINRSARDGYWGAKIVMSFTDEQLNAAVSAGRYSDPTAAAYLLRGLRERRDATGRYWFAQVSPLDDPRVEGGAVVFDDLWTRHFGGAAQYRWEFDWDGGDLEADGVSSAPRIELPVPTGALDSTDPEDARAQLDVWRSDPTGGDDWAPRPATIWLEWDAGARSYRVIGVRY
jgi:hypothetical protein